jgi:hypothetical protein
MRHSPVQRILSPLMIAARAWRRLTPGAKLRQADPAVLRCPRDGRRAAASARARREVLVKGERNLGSGALGRMEPNTSHDHVDAFVVELLRPGMSLSETAADPIEGLPADA